MIKRTLIVVFAAAFMCNLIGQEIIAEKEKLGEISIGIGPGKVSYLSTEEGFYSPGGVFVDSSGGLFFIPNFRDRPILRLSEGEFTEKPIPSNLPDTWYGPSSFGVSQSGASFFGTLFFSLVNGASYQQTNIYNSKYMKPAMANSYPTQWGAVWESIDHRQLVSAEFRIGEAARQRSLEETRSWLPTQPGGFSIGSDGLLYRNGVLYSAKNVPKWGGLRFSYLGRLESGHLLWKGGGRYGSETVFIICDPDGRIEAVVKLPWDDDVQSKYYQFNYGLGPWGELYFLLPPQFIVTHTTKNAEGGYDPVYEPDPKGTSELVVVRNYLKYFGRLNDGGVRLRKDPTTTGDILGTYAAKTGFRILEKGMKEETIGGQKNVWYKVRLLDGKEGWFFGSFVQNLYDGPNGKPPPWPNVPDW